MTIGLVVVALVACWPAGLGGSTSYVVVSGHSMEPTYDPYDVVVVRRRGPAAAGDIVVYRVPGDGPGAGTPVIHRVVRVLDDGRYVMRGDNNADIDPWTPAEADLVGEVALVVPHGGRVLTLVYSWFGLGVVAIGALVWALWPRSDDDDGDDALEGRAGLAARTGQR